MEKIKQLRELTGAGIVECKQALEDAGGEIEKAVEILRKKGIAKAAKRSEREANEGVIMVGVDDAGKEGYILEVNAETDFVAKNEKFLGLVDKVFNLLKDAKPADLGGLLAMKTDTGTIEEALKHLSGTVGEKMGIKGFAIVKTDGVVAAYSHMGGRIGALVALDKAEAKELAYNMAMQVAAANPKYLTAEDVPQEEKDKEMEIYREQLAKEGKPENIIDKILSGKINKYYEEVCLLNQEYIKDDKKRVKDVLGDVKVEQFVRYSL